MPIYEFRCDTCNVIYNFYSARIDTTSQPDCPRCGGREMARQISSFVTTQGAAAPASEFSGADEAKVEAAFVSLMEGAEGLQQEDPGQMAGLMRRFTTQAGLRPGQALEEAMARMERGDDPDLVEREMGELLTGEALFSGTVGQGGGKCHRERPFRDQKLYEL